MNSLSKAALAVFAALTFTSITLPANAARIDVRSLSCGQAITLVQQNGAVVFTLTNTTYDRIVRNRFMCDPDEATENVFAQTVDNPRCLIGKRCVMGEPLFRNLFERN